MKKKLLFIFSFLLFLTSCHGTLVPKGEKVIVDNSFKMPEEFDETRQYEIKFWAKNDNDKNQQKTYEKAVEDFEKIYPNIKVNIKQYTDYKDINADVITALSNNTVPNICFTYPDYVASYKKGANVVYELDEFINDESYGLGGTKVKFNGPKKSDMVAKFLEEGIIDGKQYTMPFMRSSECLYFNKTYLVENGFEIPEVFTWDYIWEICDYAYKKSVADGIPEFYPFIYKSSDNMFIELCYQNNNPYTNDKGEALLFNDSNTSMLLSLSDKVNNKLYEIFDRVSYPGNWMNKGLCIFAVDSTAGATWMGSGAPNLDIKPEEVVQFETGVSIIPQVSKDNVKMISQGPSMCLFNSGDIQKDLASWLFMQFLLTNDIQISYAKSEGYVPVTTLATSSQEYKNYLNSEFEYDVKIAATKVVLDNISNTFVTPVFDGSSKSRAASAYLIKAVTSGRYTTKEKIEELYKKTKNLYSI